MSGVDGGIEVKKLCVVGPLIGFSFRRMSMDHFEF